MNDLFGGIFDFDRDGRAFSGKSDSASSVIEELERRGCGNGEPNTRDGGEDDDPDVLGDWEDDER